MRNHPIHPFKSLTNVNWRVKYGNPTEVINYLKTLSSETFMYDALVHVAANDEMYIDGYVYKILIRISLEVLTGETVGSYCGRNEVETVLQSPIHSFLNTYPKFDYISQKGYLGLEWQDIVDMDNFGRAKYVETYFYNPPDVENGIHAIYVDKWMYFDKKGVHTSTNITEVTANILQDIDSPEMIVMKPDDTRQRFVWRSSGGYFH